MTKIDIPIINKSTLAIYGIVIAGFSLQYSQKKVWFFEKTFLLVDIGMKVVLEMHLLILTNAHVQFEVEKLTERSYITVEILLTAKQI